MHSAPPEQGTHAARLDGGARGGPTVDLGNCDREPIHTPGAIQPHGVLLTTHPMGLVVAQVSANAGDLLGAAPAALVGRRLSGLLDRAAIAEIEQVLAVPEVGRVHGFRAEIAGRAFDVRAHRSSGLVVLELEPAPLASFPAEHTRGALERLQRTRHIGDLWAALSEVVRDITGFDRVMVYRFAEDGAGEVVAEARGDDIEGFLGLRYPASDIPQQARALYLRNRIRLIPDAAYAPVAIEPPDAPTTGEPLDLGWTDLRSVSPIHRRYLANMGVRASMSISLVHDERLWGLVACHHLLPRLVPTDARQVCAILGDVASWMLGPRLHAEQTGARDRAEAIRARLVERMAQQPDLAEALVTGDPSALDLVQARGFAVLRRGAVTGLGVTPAPPAIVALGRWIRAREQAPLFATDALPAAYPEATALPEAAGVLAAEVSAAHDLMLLWFRPEVVQEVRWAGDPREPVDASSGELSPRRSFALWKETVRGRSLPWAAWELDAARALGSLTASLILRRAAELERLASDLARAVRSRDDFLAMAAHELRTPTTTLHLQLASLRRLVVGASAPRPEELGRIDRIDLQVERIEQLVARLLDVSTITAGHLEIDRAPFDLADLAREVTARYPDAVVTVAAEGDTTGAWDRFRVDQVLTNLVSNAVRFGAGRPVDVELRGAADHVRVVVRDRGVGISAEARGRLFERFERAASPRHHPGFGLGLWIARRIVEEHGGRITVESAPGAGSTFTVELPR